MTINALENLLESVGIIYDINSPLEKIEIEDSLQYISAIVEIENYFDIDFPDEYLDGSAFESLSFLYEIIMIEVKKKASNNENCSC